jgi:hypothetical protein
LAAADRACIDDRHSGTSRSNKDSNATSAGVGAGATISTTDDRVYGERGPAGAGVIQANSTRSTAPLDIANSTGSALSAGHRRIQHASNATGDDCAIAAGTAATAATEVEDRIGSGPISTVATISTARGDR